MVITKNMINTAEYDLYSAFIWGRRGIGKTSYAVKATRSYYEHTKGVDSDTAYQMALDDILFSMDEMLKVLKSHGWRNKREVIIMDDVGVHFSGYHHSSFVKEFGQLKSLLDGVRTSTKILLMTAPNVESVAKFIQKYDNTRIRITNHSQWNRVASGFVSYHIPSGKRYMKRKFTDSFSARLPNWVFEQYNDKRELHKSELIQILERKKKVEE